VHSAGPVRDITSPAFRASSPPQTSHGLDDLHWFTADLYLESGILRAEMVSPERRLSDHLNGFLPCVDVVPIIAPDHSSKDERDYYGFVTKESLLFAVLPSSDPTPRSAGSNPAWRPTVKRSCGARIRRWTISGCVHFDSRHVSEASLRLMDKQFIPVTDATVTEGGEVLCRDAVVIINRFRVDVLFVDRAPAP
jgi:hypothetical protein